MIPAHGEPLIHRIQRQMLERGFTDITVMCAAHRAESYLLNDCVQHCEPEQRTKDIRNNSALWAYRKHISRDGTTIFLFADTYFTDECMDKIAASADRDFVVYGRTHRSIAGQNPTPETFAIVVNAEAANRYLLRLEQILPQFERDMRAKKVGVASLTHVLYESFKKQNRSFWVEQSDLTDDFDDPRCWAEKHRLYPHIFARP